jgi:hypothetical protein
MTGRPEPAGARRLAPVVLGLLALAAPACGKVGPPVAPQTRLPLAVQDLAGEVRPDGIALTWTTPRRRVDGTPLREPAAARLFRVEDAGRGEPRPALLSRGRIAGYREVQRIDLGQPAASPGTRVEGARVQVTDREGLTRERRYTYVVVTEDAQGRTSAPSRRVALHYVASPEPPRGLAATPGDREVRLTWQPPARLVDGAPLPADIAYEVLRAPGPEADAAVVTPAPVAGPGATDSGLSNDRSYHYAVRAVRRVGETTARSEPTARVAATPRDMVAPSPPRELVAVPTGADVRLIWIGSPEPDVAAYVIYRASEAGAFERVGSVPAPGTSFVDRAVPPGRHRYAVTALDGGARPNESGRSQEALAATPSP